MRYDTNYAYFRPHTEWYNFVVGVGYVPTSEAPTEAVKAMQEYNSYKFSNNINRDKTKDQSTIEEKSDSK